MFSQGMKFSKRTIQIALAFVALSLVAGIYFLFRPFPAGPSLEVEAKSGQPVVARSPAGSSLTAVREINLSSAAAAKANSVAAVNRLDQDSLRSLPVEQVQRYSAAEIKDYNQAAGYMLDNYILGSRVASNAPVTAAAEVKKVDIGGGYLLELGPYGGRVVAPSPVMTVTQAPTVQIIDLGGGQKLIIDSDGKGTVTR